MNMLAQFISNLSYRFRSENDLSDVTWTMCQTSDKFNAHFINFFFEGIDANEVCLEREKSNDDSRPDFYFTYKDAIYLVENKIGDKSHHFEQYIKRFKLTLWQTSPRMKMSYGMLIWIILKMSAISSYLQKPWI